MLFVSVLTQKDVVTSNNAGRHRLLRSFYAITIFADVRTKLPTETAVVDIAGYYVSISVGDAKLKTDASATSQAAVLKELQSILSCLPL